MMPDIPIDRIFICVGEPSGDEFAGMIVKACRKERPYMEFTGVAGNITASAGANILMDYSKMMVFGVQGSIMSMFRSIKIYQQIARLIYRENPGVFLAVAYPGINLLLCRYAHSLGCKTYFLMPPQIWAWGDFRKHFIRKWVDTVISVFPFECEYYKGRGIQTEYFVHPLLDKLKAIKRTDKNKRIGFMPGSRSGQIRRNMTVVNKLISEMRVRHSGYEYCIIMHPETSVRIKNNADRIISDNRYQTMKDCDLIITTSGTASLETYFLGVPQIFFHIPSFTDMYLFRHFIRIKEYNLANLYSGKKVVPSIISRDRAKILGTVLDIFDYSIKKDMRQL